MGMHGCNPLCDLHPEMHWVQRQLLEEEGGHDPNDEPKLLLALKRRKALFEELIEILEKRAVPWQHLSVEDVEYVWGAPCQATINDVPPEYLPEKYRHLASDLSDPQS